MTSATVSHAQGICTEFPWRWMVHIWSTLSLSGESLATASSEAERSRALLMILGVREGESPAACLVIGSINCCNGSSPSREPEASARLTASHMADIDDSPSHPGAITTCRPRSRFSQHCKARSTCRTSCGLDITPLPQNHNISFIPPRARSRQFNSSSARFRLSALPFPPKESSPSTRSSPAIPLLSSTPPSSPSPRLHLHC